MSHHLITGAVNKMADLNERLLSTTISDDFGLQHNYSEDDESDEDPLETFRSVLAALQLDELPKFASNIRSKMQQDKEYDVHIDSTSPLSGCFHILFPIIFGDGVRWLLKVPAQGTTEEWDQVAADSLKSEALTMKLLRRETTIPIPAVHAFDSSLDNPLKCPFIIMDFASGKSLESIWFDKTASKDALLVRRNRTLKDLATAMIQLDNFSFDQGGSIEFDELGQISGIGTIVHSGHDWELDLDSESSHKSDDDAEPFRLGPYSAPKEGYTSYVHPPKFTAVSDVDYINGKNELLLKFIDWIRQPQKGKAFVLSHPDFDMQNILVSEDGSLQALIDWDGAAAVPRSRGNEQYPGWLSADWDPLFYNYVEGAENDEDTESNGRPIADSPAVLAAHRATYDQYMGECRSRQVKQNSMSSEIMSESSSTNWTRQSMIASNVWRAAAAIMSRDGVLQKIFGEILKVVGLSTWQAAAAAVEKGISGSIAEGIGAEEIQEEAHAEEVEDDGQSDPIAEGSGEKEIPQESHAKKDDGESEEDIVIGLWCDTVDALGGGELGERQLHLLKTGFEALLESYGRP